MNIRPIRNDEDHRAALAAIEASRGAPEGTEEGDRLDVLLALVDLIAIAARPRSACCRPLGAARGSSVRRR